MAEFNENQEWWMANLPKFKNGIYVSTAVNGGRDYGALNELAEMGLIDVRQKYDLGAIFIFDDQTEEYLEVIKK